MVDDVLDAAGLAAWLWLTSVSFDAANINATTFKYQLTTKIINESASNF